MKPRRLPFVLLSSFVLSSPGLLADTNTWQPAAAGAWGTPANWSLGTVPVAEDDVVINLTAGGAMSIGGNRPAATLGITATGADATFNTADGPHTVTVTGATTFHNAATIVWGSTTAANNVILGTTSFTKTGAGYLEMNGSNTIGNAFLRAGTTGIRNATSLGTGNITLGDTSGSAGATLRIAGGITLARPVILETGATGTLRIDTLGASSAAFSGGATGTNNLQITSTNAGTFTVNTGAINHTGNLELRNLGTTGNGTVNVNAAIGANVGNVGVFRDAGVGSGSVVVLNNSGNAYSGNTTVNSGATLRLAIANVIPDGAGKGNVLIDGTLDLRNNETINGLSGSGIITRGAAGASTLTAGGNGASSTFSGTIQNGFGTMALTKAGSGTLTLDTANTHTGTTTVGSGAGILAISHGSALGGGTAALAKAGVSDGTLELSGGISVANNLTFSSATGFGGGGSAHIRNTGGDNTLTGTLTLTGTGGNGINLESAAGNLTVSGTVSSTVADSTRQLGLSGVSTGSVTGNINDTGANKFTVIKSNTGTWRLSGPASTYSGTTNVHNGVLLAGSDTAFGASSVIVGSPTAATLLTDGAFTIPNPIQMSANPTSGTHTLGGNTDNTSTFSGPILLAGNATIAQVATTGGNFLDLTGGIGSNNLQTQTLTFAGPGAINVSTNPITNGPTGTVAVKVTGGVTTFSTPNTYTGNTAVEAGELILQDASSLADASTVEITDGATLNLDFVGTDTIAKLTFNGSPQAVGTWGALDSGADHEDARITGTGFLLVQPTDFLWTNAGGDEKWSTASNWDVNITPTPGTLLRFPDTPDTTLLQDLPDFASVGRLRFEADAPAYVVNGSNTLGLSLGIDNLSPNSQTLNFPIDLESNNVFQTGNSGVLLTLNGDIGGSAGFTKTGPGELVLTGSNTYGGTTTLANGITAALGADSLPSTTTLAFANTSNSVMLDIAGLDQTVANMTFGSQTSGIVTFYGDSTTSLTASPADLVFAPAASPQAANLTVDMQTLGTFTYNNSAGTLVLQAGASNGTGITTVTLPGIQNSITATNLNLAGLNASSGNKSILNLGLTNAIHANNINLAAGQGRASATLQYSNTLGTGGSLQIRNAAGAGGANIIVGKNSSFNGDATVYTSLFDTTGNDATLDALIGSLTVGNAHSDAALSRQVHSNGTFRMGAGTMTANTAEIAVLTGVTPTGSNNYTATGLLHLTAGGTANIGTVTLGKNNLPTVIGATHINGQVTIDGGSRLNATTIQQGAITPGETSRIARVNWNQGTIGNITAGDLSVSGVNIVLGTSGAHTFDISSGRTAAVSSAISTLSGETPLTKAGDGTLILSGANTYTGDTIVADGVLETASAFLDDNSNLEIATGAQVKLNFSGTDIVDSLTFDGVPQAAGTTYGATGSGAAVIDDTRFSGTGKIQVGVIADPFSAWMASFTFEPGADLTKTGDADGDGLSNLLEFALDGDPSSATSSGKVVGKIDDGHFTLTLPVRAGAGFNGSGPLTSDPIDAMIYLIEGDDDLSGFSSGVEEQTPSLSAGLPALSSGDWEYRTFRLTAPVSGEPKGFLRAGASVAP